VSSTATSVVGACSSADDDVVPGPAEEPQRELVGERARGDEQRGFLAQQLRGLLLQPVDARVLAVLVVADRRPRDHPAHRVGRPGDGVGAEIDHG
jgi:hypothetical protein